MNKRQRKKLFKKISNEDYNITWRQKLVIGSILYDNLRSEITKEIDNQIIAQIRALDPDYEETNNSDEEDI